MTPKNAKERRQFNAIQRLIAQANAERQKAEVWKLKPWEQPHEKRLIEENVAFHIAEAAKIMQEVNRLTVLATSPKKEISVSRELRRFMVNHPGRMNMTSEQFLDANAEFNGGL